MDRILRIRELERWFGGRKVVDDLSVDFFRGKVTSLIGPNGAGKTTVFNLVNGFLAPDDGEIWLDDERIDGKSPRQVAHRGIGRLFQDVRVFDGMTVLDNLLVARRRHPGESPWRALASPGRARAAEAEARKAAAGWLERMGLSELRHRPAGALSYGQQKLVAIARLLVGDSRLLLLDEPTAGVHPAMIGNILETIRRLADEGKTILLVEHNMTVVLEVSDWVYFLDEGRQVSFGLPQDVLGDPEVRRTYLGV